MSDPQIVNYVKQNLDRGYSHDSVRQALLRQGWNEQQVDEAFREAGGGAAQGQQTAGRSPEQAGDQQPPMQQGAQIQEAARPLGVAIICILGFIGAGISLVTGILPLVMSMGTGFAMMGLIAAVLPVGIGVLGFLAFYLLFRMSKAGWILVMIFSVLTLAVSLPMILLAVPAGLMMGLDLMAMLPSISTVALNAIILAYLVMKRSLFF